MPRSVAGRPSRHGPLPLLARPPGPTHAPPAPTPPRRAQWVFKWRLQAEEKMRSGGKEGMTDAQIADFVSRFMPAYKVRARPGANVRSRVRACVLA
jgi:hypothetical protein